MRKEVQKLQPKYLLQKFNVERKVKLNVIFCFPTRSITAVRLLFFNHKCLLFFSFLPFFLWSLMSVLHLRLQMISSGKKASASSLEFF